MTSDQVLPVAVLAAIVILVIVGVVRVAGRRRGAQEHEFGAGGVTKVPIGSRGMTATELAPSGVVRAAGEQWTARSRSGATIPAGVDVRVSGQDGLVLIVDVEPADPPAQQ